MKTQLWGWAAHLRRAALMLLVGLGRAATAAPEPEAAAAAEPAMDEAALFALDDALRQETQVAGFRMQTVAATPAIITLVEREEILRSGARDLIDVLYLIPGFFFGVDNNNVVGVGFRGNWGHEGKVLMLVDGQEMNEGIYSTLQLGNHFPVDTVQRVEVIRGPGSVLYGGNAELAVINVITRGAEQLQGGAASLTYGQQGGGYARRNLSLALGHVFTGVEGLRVSVSGLLGEAHRSGRDYTDVTGARFLLAQENRMDPRQLNVGVQYRDLSLRFLYDDYRVTTRDAYVEALAAPQAMNHRSMLAEARHELPLNERLTLTTRLNYSRQEPWQVLETGDFHFNKRFERYRGRALLRYAPRAQLHLTAGLDASLDHASLRDTDLSGFQTLFGDSTTVSYRNVAGLAEAQWDTSLVNVVAGARVEHHSHVGTSVVPRLVLTKQVDRFHAKLLFSRAFRAPSVENINLGLDIRPERTTVFELEAGYQLPHDMYVGANAYDMTIRDPLVYAFDPDSGTDGYRNFERSGTRGAELEYALRGGWGSAQLRYSLYTAAGKEQTPVSRTDRAGTLLGLPNHRVSLAGYANLPFGFTLAPTLHLFGPRARADGTDTAGATLYAREPTQLLANLFLQREDAFVRGLTLGAGVYNAFGADFRFVQPYDGGHAPLPGHDRELLARASYTLPF